MSEGIIEIKDLTRRYGSKTAVDRLSLTIRKGEIFGLLGPNGAGKTTAILMMLGLTEPDGGSVSVCGIDSTSNPIGVKKKVGYLPEDIGFYEDMTGLESLVYTARLNGIPTMQAREKAEQILAIVGLSDAVDKKTGKYSRGMRQRLGFADVLIKDPEVVILDEPTLGIDPKGVREFLELIVGLSREKGITVLFSSHHLYQVQQVCDRVGLFVDGRLLAEGKIQELSQELFSQSPYTIEAGFTRKEGKEPGEKWLSDILKGIDGVIGVNKKDRSYLVECSKDLTPVVAKTIIDSGAELEHISKKEYGLDDIYYRYFEGGTDHEE